MLTEREFDLMDDVGIISFYQLLREKKTFDFTVLMSCKSKFDDEDDGDQGHFEFVGTFAPDDQRQIEVKGGSGGCISKYGVEIRQLWSINPWIEKYVGIGICEWHSHGNDWAVSMLMSADRNQLRLTRSKTPFSLTFGSGTGLRFQGKKSWAAIMSARIKIAPSGSTYSHNGTLEQRKLKKVWTKYTNICS